MLITSLKKLLIENTFPAKKYTQNIYFSKKRNPIRDIFPSALSPTPRVSMHYKWWDYWWLGLSCRVEGPEQYAMPAAFRSPRAESPGKDVRSNNGLGRGLSVSARPGKAKPQQLLLCYCLWINLNCGVQ